MLACHVKPHTARIRRDRLQPNVTVTVTVGNTVTFMPEDRTDIQPKRNHGC